MNLRRLNAARRDRQPGSPAPAACSRSTKASTIIVRLRHLASTTARFLAWTAARFLAPAIRRRNGRSGTCILPPTDGGSLGDDAMLQGLTSLIGDDNSRVLQYSSSQSGGNGRFGILSPVAALRLLPLLWRSRTFYLIGADVLDGAYSDAKTELRIRIANLAAAAGADASIIGFSMNTRVTPRAARAWRRLDKRVRLFARDPRSAARTSELVGRPVATAADLAFLVTGSAPPDPNALPPFCVTVGFGTSSTMAERLGGSERLVQLAVSCLSRLLEDDSRIGIVLLPHDRRGPVNDYDLAHRILDRLPTDRATVADFVHDPSHARWVAQHLDVMVSMRMHAAIAALAEGIPVAVFGYQDKAEGMLALFALEHWVLDPEAVLTDPDHFAAKTLELLEGRQQLGQQIRSHLPSVLASAAQAATRPPS